MLMDKRVANIKEPAFHGFICSCLHVPRWSSTIFISMAGKIVQSTLAQTVLQLKASPILKAAKVYRTENSTKSTFGKERIHCCGLKIITFIFSLPFLI
jgi:hypothetical protein